MNLPKIDPNHLCDVLQLCSLRKDEKSNQYIAIKWEDWTIVDHFAKDIVTLDEYQWVEIRRIYSSGHVFLSEDFTKIYLIETTKRGISQRQFTWWSPKEDSMKHAIHKNWEEVKFDLQMVELNAETRTEKRTSVKVIDVHNEIPTIDRALIRNHNENTWEKWRNLVCLMHYHVKEYTWALIPQVWVEYVTDWRWFTFDELQKMSTVAPNVWLVTDFFIKNNL